MQQQPTGFGIISVSMFAAHLFVCFTQDLVSLMAVQPEFTGSRSKHSETITTGPLKMNHALVLLFSGFIGTIKVFINFLNHSEHIKGFPQLNMSALKVCVQSLDMHAK